jgi:hypothetical protein
MDWTTGVWSPAEAKDFFSSLCVQTSSETHPASYQMGTGGSFPRVKRDWGVMLTNHPHLVLGSRMSRIFPLPISACMVCTGQLEMLLCMMQNGYLISQNICCNVVSIWLYLRLLTNVQSIEECHVKNYEMSYWRKLEMYANHNRN